MGREWYNNLFLPRTVRDIKGRWKCTIFGTVFTNNAFIQDFNVRFNSVRTMCTDVTFQIRPRQPSGKDKLCTIS